MKTCSVRFSKIGKGYTYQFYPDITPVAVGDMVLVDAGGKLSVVQVASVSDEEEPRNPDLKVVLAIIDAEQVRAVMEREEQPLTFAPNSQLTTGWKWRMAGGRGYVLPSTMDTGHLFNTFKMIWNNSMPKDVQVQPVKLYDFGEMYTDEYMMEAINHIGTELLSRKDLTASQKATINQMRSYRRKRLGDNS